MSCLKSCGISWILWGCECQFHCIFLLKNCIPLTNCSYTKPRGQQPDYSSPVVLQRGKCTVEDFCNAIHKEIVKQFKNGESNLWSNIIEDSLTHAVKAMVWGTSAKHARGQKVGLEYVVIHSFIIKLLTWQTSVMCWKMKSKLKNKPEENSLYSPSTASSVYSKNNYFARQLWIMYQIMAIISLSTIVLFSLPIDDHSAICDESSFKGMVTT